MLNFFFKKFYPILFEKGEVRHWICPGISKKKNWKISYELSEQH